MAGRERKNDAAQNSLHTIQIQGTQTLFSFKKYIKNSKKSKKRRKQETIVFILKSIVNINYKPYL